MRDRNRWRGQFVLVRGKLPRRDQVYSSCGEWVRFRNRQDAECGLLDWLSLCLAIDPTFDAMVCHENELED